MTTSLFSDRDIRQITKRGITLEEVESQIELFRRGFPFCRLSRACTVGDGIRVLSHEDMERLGAVFAEAVRTGDAMKFVPASGAATRMFEALLSVLGRCREKDCEASLAPPVKQDSDLATLHRFVAGMESFAFYEDLKGAMADGDLDLEDLIRRAHYRPILEYALTSKGLNLAQLPKGLIKFHRYSDHVRTPFEEHLVESMFYACDGNKVARAHFTVSPEHEPAVRGHLERVRSRYEKSGIRFEIGLSLQFPSTDTLAVDLGNRPFRDKSGRLLFRPGGHGALLENLGQLEGDIVFVKNIDNVSPDRLKEETVRYKTALAGLLVELRETIFGHIRKLGSGNATDRELREIADFARRDLSIPQPPGLEKGSRDERIRFLISEFDRPLRVCGMVKNEGEPGGGPFWVEAPDGTQSLQIVESSQVDMGDPGQKAVWGSSTHFNPVDLVCGLRDYLGRPFDLRKYRDPDTGFISVKSAEGRELKALELPGLWNGAMAFWNTVFVEVPISTFNPVKTVLDLLRKGHQGSQK